MTYVQVSPSWLHDYTETLVWCLCHADVQAEQAMRTAQVAAVKGVSILVEGPF